MEKQRILITVKTYPTLSRKYGETVCTAGVREDGTWVRIYPVPFRRLNEDQKYSKYDWIECRLQRNTLDVCVFRTIAIGQNGASRSPKTGDADHPKRASRSRHEVTVSWGLQPMASTTAAWRPRDFRCTVYERF